MWPCSCLGISLRKSVLALAVIDTVIAIASLVFGTIGLINLLNQRETLIENEIHWNRPSSRDFGNSSSFELDLDVEQQSEDSDKNTNLIIAMVVIVTFTVHIVFYVLNIVLGLFLGYSAYRRSWKKCHLWFNLTLVIWIITLIAFLINMISIKGGGDPRVGKMHSYFSTITSLVNILYKAYALWVVRNYVKVLRVNNTRFAADYTRSDSVGDEISPGHPQLEGLTKGGSR